MALKLGIILWTLHLCSHCFRLFWMIFLKNAMGRKFHHNYSNYSQSEATNQRYRCNPLWRAQLGSGKVSSSSSRTSRTSSSSFSSSSSSDKTRQGKTTHGRISGDTLAIPRRYPKMEKRTPSPPIPLIISTQPHLQISKGENLLTVTQSNSQWNWHIREIPNLQERRWKISMFQNMSSQNTTWMQHAPTSRNLSPN